MLTRSIRDSETSIDFVQGIPGSVENGLIMHLLLFSINFVYKKYGSPIFQLWESKTCLIYTLNKCSIMFALISYVDIGTCIYMFEEKNKILIIYIQNTWKIVRRWHHQLTHLHIHIDCSRKCFVENYENSILHNPS